MKNKNRPIKVLTVLLSLGLIIGLGGSLKSAAEKFTGIAVYENAQTLAGIEKPPANIQPQSETYIDVTALELENINLASLREKNKDVVGWITIPNTELSYPILQADDNDFYLRRTWEGKWNIMGSIYLECNSSPDFSDFSTLIYGHRMDDDSMFGLLKHYDDIEFWKKHPSVYIADDNGARRYDIFAVHEADIDTITFGLGISGRAKKEEFISFNIEQSIIDTGITPNTMDKIITLTTCPEKGLDTRWVVLAVHSEGPPPQTNS